LKRGFKSLLGLSEKTMISEIFSQNVRKVAIFDGFSSLLTPFLGLLTPRKCSALVKPDWGRNIH
jgi:hypothetical protein